MGSFIEGTLAPAVRHRPWSLLLGLLVLTCIFLFGLRGPKSGNKYGKATDDGPPSSQHSISHSTVNGLKVDPPPPPADEDEYLAICESMCPHHQIGWCIR